MKMKSRKKMILKIVIGFVIVLAAVSVLYILSSLGFIIIDVEREKKREVRLLCETDYQALLEACRELSRRVATGDLKPQQYNVRLHLHPAASRFPQPILDLEPTYVIINRDGCVQIELHGGFLHYGAMAYPKDYKKPPLAGFKLGDKKLIDGLWYYREGYERSPKLEERIEALMQKGRK